MTESNCYGMNRQCFGHCFHMINFSALSKRRHYALTTKKMCNMTFTFRLHVLPLIRRLFKRLAAVRSNFMLSKWHCLSLDWSAIKRSLVCSRCDQSLSTLDLPMPSLLDTQSSQHSIVMLVNLLRLTSWRRGWKTKQETLLGTLITVHLSIPPMDQQAFNHARPFRPAWPLYVNYQEAISLKSQYHCLEFEQSLHLFHGHWLFTLLLTTTFSFHEALPRYFNN